MGTESLAEITLGEIRAEMARCELTQHELAERLGWTDIYLWRRLHRKVPLSLGDVEAIAAALQVPVWKLTSKTA